MPKQVSCNSFYMFMIETKKRLEARGERFPRGLEDVVNIAAEIWETMTPDQKNIYKEKAKDYKRSEEFSAHKKEVRARLPKQFRENGAGPSRRRPVERQVEEEFVEPVPYLYPSDDEEAVEEFKRKKIKDRSEIMDSWRWNMSDNHDGVYDMKCYVISCVPHCRSGGYEFYPAEIGIVEFTLRQGVTNSFSQILGPYPDLPQSLRQAAAGNVNIHKIPFDVPVEGMSNDWVRVMEKILRFCRPAKNLRRLFCLSKEFNCIQGSINFLQCKAKMTEIKADKINCVDDLFQLLCDWRDKACAPAEKRTFNDCDGLIPTSPFYKHPGLLCDFHSKEGVHHCALATAKRAAFYLLQRIQSHYPITATDRHVPPPMTPEAAAAAAADMNDNTMAQAAAVNWELTRAAFQQRAAQDRDDERMSTASATTAVTRRSAVPELPDVVEMPSTLAEDLRRLAGFGGVPDCWQERAVAERQQAPDFGQSRASSTSTRQQHVNPGRNQSFDFRQSGAPAAWTRPQQANVEREQTANYGRPPSNWTQQQQANAGRNQPVDYGQTRGPSNLAQQQQASTQRPGPVNQNVNAARGPPVKTQSRVKQMLLAQLQAKGQPPVNQ